MRLLFFEEQWVGVLSVQEESVICSYNLEVFYIAVLRLEF